MPRSYESLSTEDDAEEKLLSGKSDSTLVDFTSYNARRLSSKFTLFAYILIALTLLSAGASLVTVVTTFRDARARNAPIDTLPRPDIFVGVPKNRQAGMSAPVHGGHSHSHSNCKLL